jgi:phosphoribosylformylglycinamidine synthase PurS subunit
VVTAGSSTRDDGLVKFAVQVEVRLQPGIADPQGSTIERSLPHLGFDGISEVTVGKAIRFLCDGDDEASVRAEVDDMCKRFLTNPVIEDATITVEPA